MAEYTHSLLFSVRPRHTEKAALALAPKIDRSGCFVPGGGESATKECHQARVAFSTKKRISIPQDVSPRQKQKLEKKIEKQTWEFVGEIKHAYVGVTPLRVVWIAKQKGKLSFGFSLEALAEAAAESAVSAIGAMGKWLIGQVVLSMVQAVLVVREPAVKARDRHVTLLFNDASTEHKVDIEGLPDDRGFADTVFHGGVELLKRCYLAHAPDAADALAMLDHLQTVTEPQTPREGVFLYVNPYALEVPAIPD